MTVTVPVSDDENKTHGGGQLCTPYQWDLRVTMRYEVLHFKAVRFDSLSGPLSLGPAAPSAPNAPCAQTRHGLRVGLRLCAAGG